MPEAKSDYPFVYTPEPSKKAPVIKISCGIGDTDGFPAFDVDSDAYAAKEDPKWGFLITGGAEFHMPLTVFQVTPDGLADKAGIRLGDIILEINEEDASELTLAKAHEKIEASGKKIHFLVKNMEEDEDYELGEEKSIVLRVPKPAPPPPVVTAASIEARLREMQRKLSEIAEIPKILSSTLATVSQTFEILKSTDLPQHKQQELLQYQQHRKHSYDEDALDYELSGATATDEYPQLKAKGVKGVEGKAKTKTSSTAGGAKKTKLVKDATPESDYASEGNYETNEADTDADCGDGDNDGSSDVNNNRRNMRKISATSDDGSEETQSQKNYKKKYNYTLRSMALTGIDTSDDDDDAGSEQQYSYITRVRPSKSCQQKQRKIQNYDSNAGGVRSTSATEEDDNGDDANDGDDNEDRDGDAVTLKFVATECGSEDETDDDIAQNADEDDEDFLTTTYTWSLRKIPKLQLNDESQSFDKSNAVKDEIDTSDTDEEKPNKKARWCHGYDDTEDDEKHATQWSEEDGVKEKKFYEKSEHFWPWADREKIIYKQSTCHLVRRRPLGLVEQRIKLLAKQNLSDSLERQLHGK